MKNLQETYKDKTCKYVPWRNLKEFSSNLFKLTSATPHWSLTYFADLQLKASRFYLTMSLKTCPTSPFQIYFEK